MKGTPRYGSKKRSHREHRRAQRDLARLSASVSCGGLCGLIQFLACRTYRRRSAGQDPAHCPSTAASPATGGAESLTWKIVIVSFKPGRREMTSHRLSENSRASRTSAARPPRLDLQHLFDREI